MNMNTDDEYYAWSFTEDKSYKGQFKSVEEAKEDAVKNLKAVKIVPKNLYIARIEKVKERAGMYRMGSVYQFDANYLKSEDEITV